MTRRSAIVLSAVLALMTSFVAFAGPSASALVPSVPVTTVEWNDLTVSLTEVSDLDVFATVEDAEWLDVATNFVTQDPKYACLRGQQLDV